MRQEISTCVDISVEDEDLSSPASPYRIQSKDNDYNSSLFGYDDIVAPYQLNKPRWLQLNNYLANLPALNS